MPDSKSAKQPPSLIGKPVGEQMQKAACRIGGCPHPVLASHTDGLCTVHYARNKTKDVGEARGPQQVFLTENYLVHLVQKKTGRTDIPIRQAIYEIFRAMKDSLVAGEKVKIKGFGTFRIKNYGTYVGRNPKTGDKVNVSPKKLPVFKVSKLLYQRLNPTKAKQ